MSAVANLLVTTFNRARVQARPRGYRKYDVVFRIRSLNERVLGLACAAFADLADVMGFIEEDISVGGRIAISFDARGHGSALARH